MPPHPQPVCRFDTRCFSTPTYTSLCASSVHDRARSLKVQLPLNPSFDSIPRSVVRPLFTVRACCWVVTSIPFATDHTSPLAASLRTADRVLPPAWPPAAPREAVLVLLSARAGASPFPLLPSRTSSLCLPSLPSGLCIARMSTATAWIPLRRPARRPARHMHVCLHGRDHQASPFRAYPHTSCSACGAWVRPTGAVGQLVASPHRCPILVAFRQ